MPPDNVKVPPLRVKGELFADEVNVNPAKDVKVPVCKVFPAVPAALKVMVAPFPGLDPALQLESVLNVPLVLPTHVPLAACAACGSAMARKRRTSGTMRSHARF
jgi:hypothetical protein